MGNKIQLATVGSRGGFVNSAASAVCVCAFKLKRTMNAISGNRKLHNIRKKMYFKAKKKFFFSFLNFTMFQHLAFRSNSIG